MPPVWDLYFAHSYSVGRMVFAVHTLHCSFLKKMGQVINLPQAELLCGEHFRRQPIELQSFTFTHIHKDGVTIMEVTA